MAEEAGFGMTDLPIIDWVTPASPIPASKSGPMRIIKRPIKRGSSLKMHGVFGYDRAVFLNDCVITILTDSDKPMDELKGEDVIMSDAPYEYYGMWQLAARAWPGKVLIGGLGMGLIAHIVSWRPDITTIRVVEISEDVIRLVKPYIPSRVEVIHDDFLEYVVKTEEKYNTVIVDIWRGTGERDRELFEYT